MSFNLTTVLVAAVPLLVPVVVWLVLNRRDAAQQTPVAGGGKSTKPGKEGPQVVDVGGGGRAPRFHVGEFSSGGAIGRSAKSTLVRDVLLGEHECVLFAYIEELHGRALPWGDVLDAGTGSHSLGWALALDTASVTAVTGDEGMLRGVQRDFDGKLRPTDELVIGNWKHDSFLEGRTYDVVLADYLLGALVSEQLLLVSHTQKGVCAPRRWAQMSDSRSPSFWGGSCACARFVSLRYSNSRRMVLLRIFSTSCFRG
jgi:hypothetical protein